MSSLIPRAIAVQGVGYSARLVAMQGLWPRGTTIVASSPRRVPMPSPIPADDDALLLLIASLIATGTHH